MSASHGAPRHGIVVNLSLLSQGMGFSMEPKEQPINQDSACFIHEGHQETLAKISEKFSGEADGFSERRYQNPLRYFERRVDLIRGWGTQLLPGDSILEIGCGDGYLGCLLAKEGFRYTGVDIAPGMIQAAVVRAERQGMEADFQCGNIFELIPNIRRYDAVVMLMNTFFQYVPHPALFLKQLRSRVNKKIIVDWKHITPQVYGDTAVSLKDAREIVKEVGFTNVDWRPIFYPSQGKLRPFLISTLAAAENVPGVRSLIVQRKFWAYVKGEAG